MVHISAKLAVVALAAAPALASAIAYDASEYDARDYDDMTEIEARKIPVAGIKAAAKFAGKWFNRLSTGATVLSLGGAVAGAASQPRSFDEDFAALEARDKTKKRRGGRKNRKGRKARKGGKRRGRKAKKIPAVATEETSSAEGTAQPVNPDEGAAAPTPVETRMVKKRLSARDFLLDEELQELEAREEFFNDLNLD